MPASIGEVRPGDDERQSAIELPLLTRDAARPIVWVRTGEELAAAVVVLTAEPFVGLDCETTLDSRVLCLVQIAGRERTYLIDALEIAELSALRPLLSNPSVTN